MKKHILYPLVVFCVLAFGFIKNGETPKLVIKVKHDFLNVDNLSNIYTVREDELMKYLPSGKFFARYSNLKLGSITTLDVMNPLKILLYYRDFQQIVFLDNQLSVNSENVSLEKLGYEQTDLVCASVNNSFWIYNKQNNELIRFNENSKKIASTGNLKQVLQADLNPNFMMEHNGYLFMNSPENGIYVFDIFGAFSRVVSIKELHEFQVNENLIYYQKDGKFCSYNYTLFEEACKAPPGMQRSTGARYANKKLYTGFKDSLTIESF